MRCYTILFATILTALAFQPAHADPVSDLAGLTRAPGG